MKACDLIVIFVDNNRLGNDLVVIHLPPKTTPGEVDALVQSEYPGCHWHRVSEFHKAKRMGKKGGDV